MLPKFINRSSRLVCAGVALLRCSMQPDGPPAPNGRVHSGLPAWQTGTQVGEKIQVAGGAPGSA